MRAETKKRLDRALFRERMRYVGIGVAIAGVAAVMFTISNLDATVSDQRLTGIVEHIGVLATKNSADAVTVEVKLADGRHATVIALKANEPHIGDHIDITEHKHATGRVTFTLK